MKELIHKNLEETETILLSQIDNEGIEFSNWTKEKANMKYLNQAPLFPIYNNFIYWCNLGVNIGSEQNKLRPVLIVKTSNNSPICSIIPLTSKRLHDTLWYHIDLENIDSTALVEQLRVISKLRIVNPFRKSGKLITITNNDWNKINTQIQDFYRLRPLKNQ